MQAHVAPGNLELPIKTLIHLNKMYELRFNSYFYRRETEPHKY